MTSDAHKKHAEVTQLKGGKFHHNEFAFMGAPCGLIQTLCKELVNNLNPMRIGYVDSSHENDEESQPYHTIYTDMRGGHRIDFKSNHAEYEFRSHFLSSDLVLVNGNHFKAEKQLVLINETKKSSLKRKINRLTNVQAFILDEGVSELHDFLQEDFRSLPIFKVSQISQIAQLIQDNISSVPLKGLVLAGGKSTRMGEDKGLIDYYGKPHREYLADLLQNLTSQTFISCAKEIETEYPTIIDSFADLGSYGGILSAFRKDPNVAWLTIATDIPFLNKETLNQLIGGRDKSKFATCFHNPETNFPEPLITIWEPRIYTRLLQFLSIGYTCPRKALINNEIKELELEDSEQFFNANTREEKTRAIGKLRKLRNLN